MKPVVAGALLLLARTAGGDPADQTTYYFGSNPARTDISFSSKTEITNILGTTKSVHGSASIDFDAGTGKCHLIVPVRTLNTGMDDRDRAMFNPTWLDADRHTTIEFKSKSAARKSERTWEISGTFTFRGVERDLTITADILRLPDRFGKKLGDGSWVRVKTEFKVDITKHGLVIPAKSIATVNPVWNVAINIFGTTAKPANVPVVAPKNPGAFDPDTFKRMRPRRLSKEGLPGKIYRFGMRPQLTTMSATSVMEIETVSAQSSIVGGYAGVDLEKGTGKVKLNMSVYSLKTGIERRDQKMRGPDWLDAENHRYIEFESTKAVRREGKTWTVEGNFTIHGQTRPVKMDVEMREVPVELVKKAGWGNQPGLGFRTRFTIKLSEYGVKIPDISVTSVNDEWTIRLDLVALLDPS